MQNIVIYALLGAVCVAVVTGGYISMMEEKEPTSTQLLAGVAAGGALGSAMSYFSSGASLPRLAFPMIGGGDVSEMKVGLPTF